MDGTLRVMACAPASGRPGDVEQNKEAILLRINQARQEGAQVLVLPELCLTGGSLGSLNRNPQLLGACQAAAREIAANTEGLLCVFGLPLALNGGTANALLVAREGEVLGFVLKEHLKPEEKAFFDAGGTQQVQWGQRTVPCDKQFQLDIAGNKTIACFWDDLLHDESFSQVGMADLILAGARDEARAGWLTRQAAWCAGLVPYACLACANAGGNESTTDKVYPGDVFITSRGRVLAHAAAFSGDYAIAELMPDAAEEGRLTDAGLAMDPTMPYAPLDEEARAIWCREAVEIAAQGLAARMKRIKARTATLGVSGGLDSAMALVVTCRAFDILGLPHSGIYAYSLPGLGSSHRTKSNALKLMEAFQLPAREINLQNSILKHFEDIDQDPDKHDAAYENAQARERTQVLMDKANQVGGLMVGSGDLSELALGFTTFGGDHMSMYGVNAGLYKSAIRLILRQVALDSPSPALKETLLDILDTPISPELLPGGGQIQQKTEDILGPYALNDFFLHWFLTAQVTPGTLADICQAVFGSMYSREDILERMAAFFKRFFINQFKRSCLPDGPAVLGVSLSPRAGFLFPSDVAASLWLDNIEQLKGTHKA